ncbi:hypothetical protein V9T40_012558 [Parthenolecanium corni]|uniref:Uncharacterized protein n=1 Tax=Parthenolecanium corni TaxID=536013 RepID=A0AAN9XZF4_9HEMI
MAEFIVDVQLYKDDKKRNIYKEIAVIAVGTDEVGYCLIKPPYPRSKLSPAARATVDYVTKKHHGIVWEDGYMNFVDAMRLLKDMTRHAHRLLIKGSGRARFISQLTGKITINFDDLGCPKAKNLPSESSAPDCCYYRHASKYHPYFEACSLRRVYKLKKWYLSFLEKLSVTVPVTERPQDEHDAIEKGYDVAPSGIQERLCGRRTTSKSKFTRSSYR